MKIHFTQIVFVSMVLAACIGIAIFAFSQINNTPESNVFAQNYSYSIVQVYPHDTSAFTEGLVFVNGSLYESTGLYGDSTLRQVDLLSGEVLQKIFLDDSYFGLVFEENIFTESLFSQLAQLHENLLAIKVDGITKEEYAWGFRVGFVTYGIKNGTKELYKALEDKTAGAIRGNISNAPHPSQSLALSALKSGTHESEKERTKQKLKERYLKVKAVINEHPEYRQYFEELPFNSGYFMCVRLKNLDTDKVWQLLLDKYSTGVICYGDKGLFRIAFASTPTGKIEKMFNNIYAACKDCA